MYKHILLPTDGSALSEAAAKEGIALARAVGAKVTGLTVSPPFHALVLDPVMIADTADSYQAECETRAARFLDVIKSMARGAGVSCDAVHVMAEHPYAAIIDTAKSRGCDLICMASHGRRGLSAILIGSETVKVLTHSRTAVLVCR